MNGQLKICLTGGIACGKSLLSHYLNAFGVETIDADDIVHELIPDPAARKRLAAEVFADPAKRRALEAKIHPIVKERIDNRIIELSNNRMNERDLSSFHSTQHPPFAHSSLHPFNHSPLRPFDNSIIPPIAIIPLLFEAHWEKNFDIICCVVSERETQISRMMTTRGYTRAEAEARLAAQMPVAEKAAKSHYVIHNDGTPDELKEEVKKFLTWVSTLS